jgi:hypothetical protein
LDDIWVWVVLGKETEVSQESDLVLGGEDSCLVLWPGRRNGRGGLKRIRVECVEGLSHAVIAAMGGLEALTPGADPDRYGVLRSKSTEARLTEAGPSTSSLSAPAPSGASTLHGYTM